MSKLDEWINKLCPNGVEYKKLESICNITIGEFVHKNKQKEDAKYPVFNGGITNTGFYDKYNNEGRKIIISARGANAGFVNKVEGRYWAGNSCYSVSIIEENKVNWLYVYYWMKNNETKLLGEQQTGSIPAISKKQIGDYEIPLPPLEVQCEIVNILNSFALLLEELLQELQARQKQYEYYFDKILNPNNYTKMKLEEIGKVKMCKRILKSQTNNIEGIPFYKIGTFGKEPDAYIEEEIFNKYKKRYSYPRKGDILISCSGTIGRTVIFDGKPAYFQDSNIVWLEHDSTKVINEYLFYCYQTNPWSISTGGTISRLYKDNILKSEISVPSIEEQKEIVSKLDRFNKLCNDISEGLPAEIEVRKRQYEYYRNKLLTFKKLTVNGEI